MTQRRFGPTRGAGTVIVERESPGQIEPGALGTTAYTGIMKKGPVGKAFRAMSRTQYLFRAGGLIPESQLPDAALSFYRESRGRGSLWLNRVTDGNEKKSTVQMFNRLATGSLVAEFEAGNGGRWGGKKQRLVDEYASFTALTVTLSNPPTGLKTDELVGALVKFKALPGKSFKVESNTSAGVLTFASDVDLVDELQGTSNQLLEVDLENSGEALAVLVKDGVRNPGTEFGLQFYLIEGGITSLEKSFDNLSLDPQASNYYVDVINAESDSEFLIKAKNLNIGGSLVAGQRPANYANEIETLTATTLTSQIHFLSLSSVQNAKMVLASESLGSEIIKDKLTLTNTVAGTRSSETHTYTGQPSDGETIDIGGDTFTYKNAPSGAQDIQIGGSLEDTIDNTVSVVNAFVTGDVSKLYFVEKGSPTTLVAYAKTAGTAGDSIAVATSVTGGSWGNATLQGGVDQTWDLTSEKMPFLGTLAITSGVAFAAPNDFGYGFTLRDSTLDSSREWQAGDTITVIVEPFETDALVGGQLFPDESDSRTKFRIVSNDANSITVKTGSDMTSAASAGDIFRVQYIQELRGGYDGIAEIADSNYEDTYDTETSPLRSLRGKNLGLVKLATPGITASAVQKAGVAFSESQNWQYRYEIPANITDEVDAEEFVNATIGRNDFAKVHWPSYVKVSKEGGGLKLITATGMIHGEEALIANNFQGFHKAAAGEDAILGQALALPDGMGDDREPLDEEFLNPQGINVIREKSGNLVLWGDRSLSIDPAFTFVHKREYLSHVENIFLENFDFIIFALNSEDASTQSQLIAAFIAFWTPELAKNAIVGDTVQEATQLKIDSENNTDVTRAAGNLFADMSIRIVDTVERFIIRIGQQGVTEDVA